MLKEKKGTERFLFFIDLLYLQFYNHIYLCYGKNSICKRVFFFLYIMFSFVVKLRTILVYLFLGLLLFEVYNYFWGDMSSFWQKVLILLTIVYIFSLLKDFVFWVFLWWSGFVAFCIKSILVVLGVIAVWGYIFIHFGDKTFKKNHYEIRNNIRSFFALPTSSPFVRTDENVLVVPSTREGKRDSIVHLLLQQTTLSTSEEKKKIPEVEEKKIERTEEKSVFAEKQNSSSKKIPLLYVRGAEKNWKVPLQKELESDDGVYFSRKHKTQEDISRYIPVATVLPNSIGKKLANYLLFKKVLVQVVYPVGYIFENIVWHSTEKESGLVEDVSANIVLQETGEKLAHVQYQIYSSGDLFEKYEKEFVTSPSTSANIFFVESSTSNMMKYVTFFAGKCWVITFTKTRDNMSEDDLYRVLIPAVFEAQD